MRSQKEARRREGKWEKIEAAVDSAAVDNVIPTKYLPHITRKPSARSISGRHYVAANAVEIKNHGERIIKFETNEGFNKSIMFQDADVSRCLISADKLNQAGCEVILNKINPRIVTAKKETIKLKRKNGVFIMTMWVRLPNEKKDPDAMELDAVQPAGFARRAVR